MPASKTEAYQTNLNAVTATGAGATVDTSAATVTTWMIVATGVTTGGTVLIQGSLDGTNWATISSTAVSATGNTLVTVTGRYPMQRSNVSARTDGTYTTQCALTRAE